MDGIRPSLAEMSHWRRALSTLAILAFVAVGLIVGVALIGARRDIIGGIPPEARGLLPLYYSAPITGLVALTLAALLVLRGARRASSYALALFLSAGALASLLLLQLLSGDAPAALGPVAGWLPAAVGVLACAAFLRFSVLFPQSLTPAELRGLGKLKPDDSMGRADRALGRLAHSMLGRAGPVDAPRLPKLTLYHLVQRLPTRMQRIARFTVLKDAGRLLTEPPIFWSIAAGIAATPYVLWWAFEWLPTWLGIGLFFVWFSTIPMAVLLGVAVLRHGYAVAAPVDRRRMRWIIESLNAAVWAMIAMGPFILLAWIGVENALAILMPGIVFSVVPLLVIGGFTVAVLYGGALEPRLAVRRSTIYGLFGLALAFVYAVIEELVSTQLVARVGLSEGSGTLMAAGVIAVVFGACIQKFRLRAEAYLRNAAASPGE